MSKREETKAIEDTQRVAEEAKSIRDKNEAAQTLQKVGQQQQQARAVQDFQLTFHKSLDETKENVRKSINEARTQIPRYHKCSYSLSRTGIRIDWKNGRRLY